MEYREMRADEVRLVKTIDGRCFIKNAWRMNPETQKYELIEINWTDEELPNGLAWHENRFVQVLKNGGKAFGCFDKDVLLGYATIEPTIINQERRCILLDQLFVSNEYRGKGIGKELARLCKEQLDSYNCDVLYVCAGSSEDTIAFYKKLGFVPATVIDEELFAEDPNDIQMEWKK